MLHSWASTGPEVKRWFQCRLCHQLYCYPEGDTFPSQWSQPALTHWKQISVVGGSQLMVKSTSKKYVASLTSVVSFVNVQEERTSA